MAAFVRRHHAAILALAVYNFAFFFPVAYMGRVVSPNDVYLNYEPWATVGRADIPHVQNSLLNDPPTAYLTLMALMKSGAEAFHWNPYIAAGIPGYGSSAAALLSPFIFLPVLLVPLAWVYTAIIFLKLNVAFLLAYAWLREEKLGERGAAIGALVIAGAGIYTVRWLWQITNATVLYPALLLIVRRAFNGKRNSIALTALVALAYALSGFPAAMAYGAYVALLYVFWSAVAKPPLWKSGDFVAALLGVVLALMIAAPSLVPFVQLVKRSGYLAARETASLQNFYPATHWRSFIDPDRLGNPANRNWSGDAALGMLNNYFEATVFLGILTIPLALLGIFNRDAKARWFWLAIAAIVLACMFGAPGIASVVGKLPGFKYSVLTRVSLLLPLAAGYLAAAGGAMLQPLTRRFASALSRSRERDSVRSTQGEGLSIAITIAIAALLAFELSLFAGRFHPYLEPRQTNIPVTPTIEFLQRDAKPFRIAPFFLYLWPNSSELFRLEDIRSHFGSEAAYRRMLQRIDPSSWSGRSTVIQLNSLQLDLKDPLLGMLGVRWLVEQNAIDIVKWKIFESTIQDVAEEGALRFAGNVVFERTIAVDRQPFWAIEVPVTLESQQGRVELTLLKNEAPMWTRTFTPEEVAVMNKLYVPLRPYARQGEVVRVRFRSLGARGFVGRAANVNANEAPLYYARVAAPIIFDRQLADGRLFRNVGEVPRFHAVTRLRKLNDDEFLAARDVDFLDEAVITDDPVMPPDVGAHDARVTLQRYANDEQRIVTESSAPFFLASSEKLTPELRVTIDGKRARAIEINMLFAGVTVPAGRHEIVFSRRLARGWWWLAGLGVLLWIAIAGVELLGVRRRSRRFGARAAAAPPQS